MSKKIVVVAHHHGAFLTLNSVFQDKEVGHLIVLIPESQIKKYSTFDDATFVNFEKNLKTFIKKNRPETEVYVVAEDEGVSRFTRVSAVLEELGETGVWLSLLAGSIYNKDAEWITPRHAIAACPTRSFSGPHDMYAMIGLQTDNSMNSDVFFVNCDVPRTGNIHKLPSKTFGRQDALIGPALSSVECLKWSAICTTALACSVWMRAINRDLKPDEFVAYPFDIMVPHAKATKKFLPVGAYAQILKNAEESGWYSDLRSTYL